LLNVSMIIMLKYFVIRHFSGTRLFVEMLKGCMLIFGNSEGVHVNLSEC